ncbi:hypothetical protein JW960_18045 [candidate division KSB1 bacterium]|nr:hypothetical protein [candidate division KSB1 bacterium]
MRSFIYSLVLVSSLFLSCGSSTQMLPTPTETGNLIIGSILLDIDGYDNKFTVIWDRVEVALVGQYIEQGELKTYGKWIVSDENGYFFVPNVPDGEYSIKGFRVKLFGDETLTFVDPMDMVEPIEFELTDYNGVVLAGTRFDIKPYKRIINFQHNYFRLKPNGRVDFNRMERIHNLRLTTGEVLDNPPVPVYFIEGYPNNPWVGYLNMVLK